MSLDAASEAFWQAYLATLPCDHPHRARRPDAFGFGDTAELADELAALVLAGVKRATTSLAVEFTSLGEPLPEVGDVSLVLFGSGAPAAIIERTHVERVPFCRVDARYAALEGEGDGSLASWRLGHTEYFQGVCARLGGKLEDDTLVLCQAFRVLWPTHLAGAD